MKTFISIRLILMKLMMVTLFAAPSFAKQEASFFKANERFPILTYDEFRRLRPERQEEYMQVMRGFAVALSQAGLEGQIALAGISERSPFWQQFFFGWEAQAREPGGDCSQTSFSAKGNFIPGTPNKLCATYKDGSGMKTECGTPNTYREALRCSSQYDKFYREEDPGPASQKEWKRGIDQARVTDTAGAPPDAGAAPPGRLTAPPPPLPPASADSDLNRKFAKDFKCIYSGFALVGNCYPPVYITDNNANPPRVYSCKKGVPNGKAITPDPLQEGSVLCNPVLFGLNMKDLKKPAPICVANSGNATAACKKAADAMPGKNIEAAKVFAEGNREEYDRATRALTQVCQGNFSSEDSKVNVNDIKKTCKEFSERFADLGVMGSSGNVPAPNRRQ